MKISVARVLPFGKQWSNKKLCGDSTDYATRIKELNKEMLRFVSATTTPSSPVILVDQFTGIDPAKEMYDDIHPNEAGEKIMAKRWFAAMRGYIRKLD